MKNLLAILLVCGSLITLVYFFPAGSEEEETVSVLIRIDDVGISYYNHTELMRFLDMAERHDVKVVLAVTPAHLPNCSSLAKLLQNASKRGHQIVLHGYNHSKYFQGHDGEFYSEDGKSVPKEVQEQKIRDGYNILVGLNLTPKHFVPPWHLGDETTKELCDQYGMDYHTDKFKDARCLCVYSEDVNALLDGFYWSATQHKSVLYLLHVSSMTPETTDSFEELFIYLKEKNMSVTYDLYLPI